MIDFIKNKSQAVLEQTGGQILADSINALLAEQDRVVLAVPGGRSVAGIFRNLNHYNVDWNRVHIFMVDERMVPLGHDDSNFKLVEENLLEWLYKNNRIGKDNVHPFDIKEGIAKYQAELESLGAKYDIVLLSSGEDGHIGALYPNHHSITDADTFFITMEDSPKPPPQRMTMSRSLLLKTKIAMLLFFGETKKDALDKFNNPAIKAEDCPAKLVGQLPQAYVLTDL